MITPYKDLPFITYDEWLVKQKSRTSNDGIELDLNIYKGLTADQIVALTAWSKFDFYITSPTIAVDGNNYIAKSEILGQTIDELHDNLNAFFDRTIFKVGLYSVRQCLLDTANVGNYMPGIYFAAKIVILK